jgi:hypothetical protein
METAALTPTAIGLPPAVETNGCSKAVEPDRAVRRCEPPPATAETTSSAALRFRRSERTALYIETQEGDVVRLKIKVRDSLHAATHTGDDGATLTEVAASSTIKIRFSVEGDLNADELAAIRSVVEQATAIAGEFFAGDAPEAFAAAAGLEIDGAQLARVGLRLAVREQLGYAASTTYRRAPAPAPIPAPAAIVVAPSEPAAEPAAAAPTAATPAATETPAPSDVAP